MTTDTVKVWDPFVRLSHWVLAVSFLVAYFTAEALDAVHEITGYIALVTAVLRIAWGFVGPRHARFSDFVCRPDRVFAYLFQLLTFRGRRYIGHSPAGGAMVVALLAVTVAAGWTGAELEEGGVLLAEVPAIAVPAIVTPALADDHEAGSDGGPFEELHEFLGNLGIVLVVLHLGGVALASLVHRENLPRAMVTGRKRPE